MGEFNFEDYRQPWETGPHWELKREFMEKYRDMFSEDRLLCLAQAYSNIVLMNCSYPDPVMRQISLLSEPLQMRRKFQEASDNSNAESPKQEDRKVSEKMKLIYQNSGRPFKQMKFCTSEEQEKSVDSPVSAMLTQNSLQESVSINTSHGSSSSYIHGSSVSNQPYDAIKHMDIDNSQLIKQENSAKDSSSQFRKGSVMYLLATLNEKMEMLAKERIHKQYPFNAFMDAAASLKMKSFIKYERTKYFKTILMQECECKFFFKNVLISIGKGRKKSSARASAVVAGIEKFKHLSNYKIHENQLVEYEKSTSNETRVSTNPHSSNEVISENVFEKQAFVLNQSLFQASLKDSFVLLDNLALKSFALRTLKMLIAESVRFSCKTYKYNCEDVPERNLQKVDILIQDEVVGTGTASMTKNASEAKNAAAYNAVEMLRKKYYTIRVKNEYGDGFIITQNQVLDGESFSSTALTDLNIGCSMLKNMGSTGSGLGTSGISEPVEACGQHGFKQGLGYGQKKSDKSLFRKRIHSMLQEYDKSNSLSDLIFSKEFSEEERKEISQIARTYKLHTASRGIDDNMFLSVRRKYTAMEVLMYLVNNAGGSSSKFELVDASKSEKFDTAACVIKRAF